MLNPNPNALLALSIVLAIGFSSAVLGCGPYLPSHVITVDKKNLLLAPEGSFAWAVKRIPAPFIPPFKAKATDIAAERAELQQAMRMKGYSVANINAVLPQFDQLRAALAQLAVKPEAAAQQISLAGLNQIPDEFADYLQGAVHYRLNRMNEARTAWERLLTRPEQERHFRSVWAAYMLGKLAVNAENHAEALTRFRQVRSLITQGFADSQGLGADSLGEEARVELQQRQYPQAIELYRAQMETGADSAYTSLVLATRRAFFDSTPEELRQSAQRQTARRIMSGYMIAVAGITDTDYLSSHREVALTPWLTALKQANLKTVEDADLIAWGAYHAGQYREAEQWLALAAHNSPFALWIKAKLQLRAGQIRQAAMTLQQALESIPDEHWFAVNESTMTDFFSFCPKIRLGGELATLHLAREDFVTALGDLMRSANWPDAAYVAERILTLDELKSYVERHYPKADWPVTQKSNAQPVESGRVENSNEQNADIDEMQNNWPATPESLHYLLARRLARSQRRQEAMSFYPPQTRLVAQRFVNFLAETKKSGTTRALRARNLWQAAQLLRQQGMQLVATELEPDWFIHTGEYEETPINALRTEAFPPAGRSERQRSLNSRPQPDKRFHYRYLAADLAWQAAEAMPEESVETATVLTTAGNWLKYRDPKSTERFYKALVRRCGKTPLGQTAMQLHWLPDLATAPVNYNN